MGIKQIIRLLRREVHRPFEPRIQSAFADEVDTIATKHGVNPLLIAAIIEIESAGNTFAIRYEPGWNYFIETGARGMSRATEEYQQKVSWGLMQVMGTVAREHGFDGPFLSALCQPSIGIEYGVRHFRKQLDRYNGSEVDAVAAYNAGTVVKRSGADYANQSYVTKVWNAYGRLRGDA